MKPKPMTNKSMVLFKYLVPKDDIGINVLKILKQENVFDLMVTLIMHSGKHFQPISNKAFCRLITHLIQLDSTTTRQSTQQYVINTCKDAELSYASQIVKFYKGKGFVFRWFLLDIRLQNLEFSLYNDSKHDKIFLDLLEVMGATY